MLQPNIWCLFQLGQKEELLPFDVNPRTVPVKHAAIVVSLPNFLALANTWRTDRSMLSHMTSSPKSFRIGQAAFRNYHTIIRSSRESFNLACV